jgi:hypothetical protein
MPYLDLNEYENYQHLCQLFFAAHPAYRATNEALRADTASPGEYFLTPSMARELATWARARALITRTTAAWLMGIARTMTADPASIVSLTPRVLGTPPRLQPSVLSTEIYHWLKLAPPHGARHDEIFVFTIDAAIGMLEALMDQPDMPEQEKARAYQLIAWLQEQEE